MCISKGRTKGSRQWSMTTFYNWPTRVHLVAIPVTIYFEIDSIAKSVWGLFILKIRFRRPMRCFSISDSIDGTFSRFFNHSATGDTNIFPKISFHGRSDCLVIDTHTENSPSAALHPGTYMILGGQVIGKHSSKYLDSVNKMQFTSTQPYMGLGLWNWPFTYYNALRFWWTNAESPFTEVPITYYH